MKKMIFILLAFSHSFTNGQTFFPPTSLEQTFPAPLSPYIVSPIGHTSCNNMEDAAIDNGSVWTSWTKSDAVISAWDQLGGSCAVAWRYHGFHNPSVLVNEGVIPYTNVRDLEVSLISNWGGWYSCSSSTPMGTHAIVAYYKNGVGHFFDVYKMMSTGPVLLFTRTLSTMATYSRISIDNDASYALITWEEPTGIKAVGIRPNCPFDVSGVVTLDNTAGETEPDCAFTSITGTLGHSAHFVYYNPSTNTITESKLNFSSILFSTGGILTPTIEDVNSVGSTIISSVNIDCPDRNKSDSWAYTYSSNSSDIVVRLVDYKTTTTPSSVIVNDGSLGNAPINGASNIFPFLAYERVDAFGTIDSVITVGWHTSFIDPSTLNPAGYVAVRIDETGTILKSPMDYLSIPNSPSAASITPILSFSKNSEYLNTYFYAIFPEYSSFQGGMYWMQNKYHAYGGPFFKKTKTNNQPSFISNVSEEEIIIFPNPFRESLHISYPSMWAEDNISLRITDVSGRIINKYNGQLKEVNSFLENFHSKFISGVYVFNYSIEGRETKNKLVTKIQ